MANKRIELEQYKHYVDLLHEEPNRKRWRQGIQAALITAMLVALLFFVLALLSGSLASNPRNILEKPPAPAPATPSTPQGITPTSPEGGETPVSPTPSPVQVPGQGRRSVPGGPAFAAGAREGALLAQADPQQVPVQGTSGTSPQVDQSAPAGSESVPGATQSAPSERKAKKPTGPGEQTTGVGNLANLTNGAGGRGFQLYVLVLFLALVILLYLPIRRARLEAKSK